MTNKSKKDMKKKGQSASGPSTSKATGTEKVELSSAVTGEVIELSLLTPVAPMISKPYAWLVGNLLAVKCNVVSCSRALAAFPRRERCRHGRLGNNQHGD